MAFRLVFGKPGIFYFFIYIYIFFQKIHIFSSNYNSIVRGMLKLILVLLGSFYTDMVPHIF